MILRRLFLALACAGVLSAQLGCATGNTKQIVIGMAAGAATGAIVGHEFVHHGAHKQFQTQNTIITSVLFALITGGVMAWHYEALQNQAVEISGRYARYRLCNPDELPPGVAKELGAASAGEPAHQLQADQIGKFAIALDDNTKWTYPIFRKRYLQPERGESEVVSSRYIWEILKPGSFVTRSQDPQFFVEPENKK